MAEQNNNKDIYNKNNKPLITNVITNNHLCPINNGQIANQSLLKHNDPMECNGIETDVNNNISARLTEMGDTDNFFKEQFIKRDNCSIAVDVVEEAFEQYCRRNNLEPTIKGVKLINMIADRNHVEIVYAGKYRFLRGYILKHDPRMMEDKKFTHGYRRLWYNWTQPYLIGWKNGPYPYPLDMETEEWSDIDIKYTDTLPSLSIEDMVQGKSQKENTKEDDQSVDINRLQTIIYTRIQAKEINSDLTEETVGEVIKEVLKDYYQKTNNIEVNRVSEVVKSASEIQPVPNIVESAPNNIKRIIIEYLREIDVNVNDDSAGEDDDVINGAIKNIMTTMDENIINFIQEKYVLAIKAGCGSGKTNKNR